MTEWIVAHSHLNAESRAEMHLLRQGFEVYLPKYKKTRRHARRVESVIRPLFPRYLFVGFIRNQTQWRSIRSTIGVSHLIAVENHPLVVPSWVVEQLRSREDDAGLYTEVDTESLLSGETVKITEGPFFNQQGIFDGLTDSQRVQVLLDVMGRQVKALLPRQAVRRAS